MATSPALPPRLQLARALRERFLAEAGKAAQEIGGAVQERLTTLMDELVNAREAQLRRDTWMAYKRCRPLWVDGTMRAWRRRAWSWWVPRWWKTKSWRPAWCWPSMKKCCPSSMT